MYFSKEVEEAIVEYNNKDTSYSKKCYLYREYIYPAFDKLAENIIHTNKYYNFEVCYEDTKHEAVAKLTEKIHKFSPERGKAFSFFDRSCRNYLISYNKRVYKKKIRGEDLSYVDSERDLNQEYFRKQYTSKLKDFVNIWVSDMSSRIFSMFSDDEYVSIADSILELFNNRESLDFFNKKALYILVKERSRVSNSNDITSVVKVLKKNFYSNFEFFNTEGYYGRL